MFYKYNISLQPVSIMCITPDF